MWRLNPDGLRGRTVAWTQTSHEKQEREHLVSGCSLQRNLGVAATRKCVDEVDEVVALRCGAGLIRVASSQLFPKAG